MSCLSFQDDVLLAAQAYVDGGSWKPLQQALARFYGSWTCKPCSREHAAKQVRLMENERAKSVLS